MARMPSKFYNILGISLLGPLYEKGNMNVPVYIALNCHLLNSSTCKSSDGNRAGNRLFVRPWSRWG